jgi:hypothetical protein
MVGRYLHFMMNGAHNIQVLDESGHAANIGVYDVAQARA